MVRLKLQLGFTLIEMMVVAALFGMLSVGLASTFLVTLRMREYARIEALLRAEGDQIVTTLERNIRMAKNLPTCNPEGDDDNDVSQIIRFRFPNDFPTDERTYSYVVYASGNPNSGYISYQYYPLGVNNNDASRLNSSATVVTGFVAKCIPDPSGLTSGYIDIKFTLRVPNSTIVQQFHTRAAMRNLN